MTKFWDLARKLQLEIERLLYHFNDLFAEARMYQNNHGRFTAVDPLLASGKSANPQTFNRYVYVINNPLMFVDPDGLQTATAGGKVFRRGRNFAIFKNDKPAAGYRPVTRTVNTRTTINGVEHHWQIRPNGWTVGDRVDGAKFERTPAPVESQPRSDISVVSAAAVNGVKDGAIGIGKGLVNAVPSTWNGATGLAFMSPAGLLTTGGVNPLAVPLPLPYSNALQSSYGSASGAGALTGGGLAFGTIFGGASMPSVVPQFPKIPTPYGSAVQSLSPEALAARESVEGGALLFRRGTLGTSQGAEAQFWSLQHPMNPNFASQSGLPSSSTNFNFIETGRLSAGQPFITRPAPAVGNNPGGGIEVVTNPCAVRLCNFSAW